jgi:hypothetical protein
MRLGSVPSERTFVQQASGSRPGPVGAATDEAGLHGVVEDVFDRSPEVLLRLDDSRREAVAEEVPPAPVAAVEALRVDAVEPLHPDRKVLARGLEHQVVVVVEQAERLQAPARPDGDACEQAEELATVLVAHDDRALLDAPRADVEVAVREERAERTGHGARRYRLPNLAVPQCTDPPRSRHTLVTNAASRRANTRVRPWFGGGRRRSPAVSPASGMISRRAALVPAA